LTPAHGGCYLNWVPLEAEHLKFQGVAMPKTLLLADDSTTIQKVVGICLAGEDVKIIYSDNGEDAIFKASVIKPDLVIADVTMPRKTGYEVSIGLRGNPETSSIPVILLTGAFEPFDENRFKESGASAYISKPFDSQSMIALVRKFLHTEEAPERKPVSQAIFAKPAEQVSAPRPVPPPPIPPMRPPQEPRLSEPAVMDELSSEEIEALATASSDIIEETVLEAPARQEVPVTLSEEWISSDVLHAADKTGESGFFAATERRRAAALGGVSGFTPDELREMVRKTIKDIVERVAREVVEEVAWESVPELAEMKIREELKRLLAEEEKK
jgi:CheY-like chemotaxis protein